MKRKKIPCLQQIQTVANNGNLMINTVPKADGTIPEEQKKSLPGLGRWLSVHGEAIYGTEFYERRIGSFREGRQ